MGKVVQVKSSFDQVLLPTNVGLRPFRSGASTTLTDAEYAALTASTTRALTITSSGVADPVRPSIGSPQSLADAVAQAKAYSDSLISGLGLGTAATHPAGDFATPASVTAAVTALVNSSPAALDTLKELADALGDDPNFATTITNLLALKAPLVSPALSGNPTVPTQSANDNSTKAASTAYADRAALAVRGRKDLVVTATGLITENFDLSTASANLSPVSGTVYGSALGFQVGDVVTNILIGIAVAGSGTAPTLFRVGLADLSNNVLAISAELHASSLLTSAGIAAIPMGTPYIVPASGTLKPVLLKVGAFGTTDIALARASITAGSLVNPIGAGIRRVATYGTAQTDLPAVNSALAQSGAAVTTNFWFGVT